MLIGELARRTGVSQRSLRYYEQQGLLSAERDVHGYRCYGPDSVRTVARIRALLAVGLSTDVIREVLPCVTGGDPIELELCPDLVRTIRRELAELDARIGELQCSRSALAGYLTGWAVSRGSWPRSSSPDRSPSTMIHGTRPK